VSERELATGLPKEASHLAPIVARGFDVDGDGLLSLSEYRLSMLANPLAPWRQKLVDLDEDGQLTFTEFSFGVTGARMLEFPLLRWVYFQRLDKNGDGGLDANEFLFRAKDRVELFSLNADGTGWRPLLKLDEFPHLGSPDVSRDGKQLVFDAWGKTYADITVFTIDLAGGTPRKILSAYMPTWSADGRWLACSRDGVRIVNLDDGAQRVVEQSGWGSQWSPDGTQIAFLRNNAIQVFDMASETVRTVLGGGAHPYQRISYNVSWSPDCKKMCFKATRHNGVVDVVTVNVDGGDPQLKVHATTRQSTASDSAWHPDGTRVVFSMPCSPRWSHQLYEFDPRGDDPPRLVEGQDPDRCNREMSWTPDGKRLILTSGGN
jgi:Tol biopolymer transport system component